MFGDYSRLPKNSQTKKQMQPLVTEESSVANGGMLYKELNSSFQKELNIHGKTHYFDNSNLPPSNLDNMLTSTQSLLPVHRRRKETVSCVESRTTSVEADHCTSLMR